MIPIKKPSGVSEEEFRNSVQDKYQNMINDNIDYINTMRNNQHILDPNIIKKKAPMVLGAGIGALGGLGLAAVKDPSAVNEAIALGIGAAGAGTGGALEKITRRKRTGQKLLNKRFGENAPRLPLMPNSQSFRKHYFEGLENERENNKNAFEIVNYEFQKIADEGALTVGLATGMLGGSALGILGGKGIAKLTTRLTPEMKVLLKDEALKTKQLNNLQDKYNNLSFDSEEFLNDLQSNPKYNSLTVGEVDNLAKNYYSTNVSNILNEINSQNEKTASAVPFAVGTAATGIPLTGLVGRASYVAEKKRRTDSNLAKASILSKDRQIKKLEAGLPFDEFISKTKMNRMYDGRRQSPYLYLSKDIDDDRPYYASLINEGLEEKGMDYKKMNFKKYDELVNNFVDHAYRSGDEDAYGFLEYELE